MGESARSRPSLQFRTHPLTREQAVHKSQPLLPLRGLSRVHPWYKHLVIEDIMEREMEMPGWRLENLSDDKNVGNMSESYSLPAMASK